MKKLLLSVGFVMAACGVRAALPQSVSISSTAGDGGLVRGSVELRAAVSDDSENSYAWHKLSGPGVIFFDDASATNTIAEFSATGDYIVGFAVADEDGAMTNALALTVTKLGFKQNPDLMFQPIHASDIKEDENRHAFYEYGGLSFESGRFSGTRAVRSVVSGKDYGRFTSDTSYTSTNPVGFAAALWCNFDDKASLVNPDNDTAYLVSIYNKFALGLVKGDSQHPVGEGWYVVVKWWCGRERICWSTAPVMPTSGWKHLAFSMKHGLLRESVPSVYLDGVQIEMDASAFDADGTLDNLEGCLTIGNWYYSKPAGVYPFPGLISDVRLFAHELGRLDIVRLLSETAPVDHPPVVEQSGPFDLRILRDNVLPVTVTDDGVSAFTAVWTAEGENATQVTFVENSPSRTVARFSEVGDYLLVLTVTDGTGVKRYEYDVHAKDEQLCFAGSDAVVVRDDWWLEGRLPCSSLIDEALFTSTCVWRQVSGPATATIANPDLPHSAVVLPAVAGEYVFELKAVTSRGVQTDSITIKRILAAEDNQPPVLSMSDTSSNGVVRGSVQLTAVAADPDGYPSANLRVRWYKVSGPGGAFFTEASSADTVVTFSTPGDYVLGVEADDGADKVAVVRTLKVEKIGDKPDPEIAFLPIAQTDFQDVENRWWVYSYGEIAFADGYFAGTRSLVCPMSSARACLTSDNVAKLPCRSNTDGGTLACWVNVNDTSVETPYLISFFNGMTLRLKKGTAGYFVEGVAIVNGSTRTFTTTTEVLPTTGWHHLAFSAASNATSFTPLLTVDGAAVAVTGPACAGTVSGLKDCVLTFGNRYYTDGAGGYPFPGLISDIRVYAHALGTLDIARLLKAKNARNQPPEVMATAYALADIAKNKPVTFGVTAYDDGLPATGTFTTTWRVAAGDASKVVFADASDPTSTVTFKDGGEYRLELVAKDGEFENVHTFTAKVPMRGLMVFFR